MKKTIAFLDKNVSSIDGLGVITGNYEKHDPPQGHTPSPSPLGSIIKYDTITI